MSKDQPTTIHFVRHGTVHNPQEIFYGRLPRFSLSTEGRLRAQKLGRFFENHPIQAIFSSPLLRARQTASEISLYSSFSKRIYLDTYLNEIMTPFDGQPLHSLDARNWDIYTDTLPPYEQPIDVFNRTQLFISKIFKTYKGQQVIAVTHADVIVFFTLWLQGFPVNYETKSLIEQKLIPIQFPEPASVSSFTWEVGSSIPTMEYFPNE